jgi:predicted kinase
MTLPFKTKSEKQIIIFIGIQASGKSTFYHKVLSPIGFVHINLDTLHTRHKEQEELLRHLNNSKSIVVDNTNPEQKDRERYITLAKAYDYEIIGIFFQSIVRDCIIRNENRINKVPTKAIPCTQNRLQLPSLSEGFDQLYFAKITNNDYELSKWKE